MKQKYTITIGDIEMNVISEESPEAVERIVGHVDRKMRELIFKSPRTSKHEAALLCALDYCSEKLTMQGKLTEVEEQNDKLFRALERIQRDNEKLNEALELEQARTAELTAALEQARAEANQERARAQAAAAAAVAATASAPKDKDAGEEKPAAPIVETDTVPAAVVATAESQKSASAQESAPAQDAASTQESAPAQDAAPAETEKPAVIPVATPVSKPSETAGVVTASAAEDKPAETDKPATKSSVGTATAVDHIAQKKKNYSFRSSAAARAKNKVGNMFETLTFHDDE